MPSLQRRIDEIAKDRESGAAALLDRALGVLTDALTSGDPIRPIAAALCRAQPSMAPFWTAALQAVTAEADPERFARFVQRVRRSPAALARVGASHLATGGSATPLSVVTISASGSVLVVLQALQQRQPVRVACSESRPALEGRRLAETLAQAGIAVTCVADAAIGQALDDADLVLVGADAVAPAWILNKTGTRMLAADATLRGIPVHVVASRDKFVADAVAARLTIREGAPEEIWRDAPAGVRVRNPYFERIPLDLIAGVITDTGVLGAGMIPEACRATLDEAARQALGELGRT